MVKVDDSGQVTLITGASELGQGSETVLAMMVAEGMRVPLEAGDVAHPAPATERQVEHRGNLSAAYGFGAHVAEVEVDPGTGMVRLLGYWTAHDVGRAINPMSCEGQIEGGTAMGIGLALSEGLVIFAGQLPAPTP